MQCNISGVEKFSLRTLLIVLSRSEIVNVGTLSTTPTLISITLTASYFGLFFIKVTTFTFEIKVAQRSTRRGFDYLPAAVG